MNTRTGNPPQFGPWWTAHVRKMRAAMLIVATLFVTAVALAVCVGAALVERNL